MRTIKLLITLVLLASIQLTYGQEVNIDLNKSNIKWSGSKKIGGAHNGEIQLKSGIIEYKGDKIIKAKFIVDMNSLTDLDLKDEGYNKKLVGHLKSDDFFGVEKFPTAELMLNNISNFTNDKAFVYGKITIKGRTQDITFEINKDNKTYTAKIEIDRSKFNVRYGSNSFFDNLGDKVINDIFVLDIKIVM